MEDRFSFIYRLKKIQYVSLSNFFWVGQMGSVWSFGCATWTLIALGEVKVVDLANFDLKFLAKFSCTRFVQIPIFAIMSSKCFLTSGKTSKNDLYNHFDIFFKKIQRGATLPIPPFRSVLLLLQTTWWREKSRRAEVRSPVWRQSIFQSVSGPGPCRVRGWQVLSRACPLLFLSGQLALHRSRQIPKTVALYYTPSKYWGR